MKFGPLCDDDGTGDWTKKDIIKKYRTFVDLTTKEISVKNGLDAHAFYGENRDQ